MGRQYTVYLELWQVAGIKALHYVPLSGQIVEISFILGSLTPAGVNSLFDFRRDIFKLPEEYYERLPPLMAADNLGDDEFIDYVAY